MPAFPSRGGRGGGSVRGRGGMGRGIPRGKVAIQVTTEVTKIDTFHLNYLYQQY